MDSSVYSSNNRGRSQRHFSTCHPYSTYSMFIENELVLRAWHYSWNENSFINYMLSCIVQAIPSSLLHSPTQRAPKAGVYSFCVYIFIWMTREMRLEGALLCLLWPSPGQHLINCLHSLEKPAGRCTCEMKMGCFGYRFCINIITLFYREIINNLFYVCFIAFTDLRVVYVNWWYIGWCSSHFPILYLMLVRCVQAYDQNWSFGDSPRGTHVFILYRMVELLVCRCIMYYVL